MQPIEPTRTEPHRSEPDRSEPNASATGGPDAATHAAGDALDAVDELDLDAIERDLDDVERTLDRLADGTYWAKDDVGDVAPDATEDAVPSSIGAESDRDAPEQPGATA